MKHVGVKKVLFFITVLLMLYSTQVMAEPEYENYMLGSGALNNDDGKQAYIFEGDISGAANYIGTYTKGYQLGGQINFVGNTAIDFTTVNKYSGTVGALIALNDQQYIESAEDSIIKITMSTASNASNYLQAHHGIYASEGGIINLSNSQVEISALRGIQAWNGEVYLGDNSKIYAYENHTGYAAGAIQANGKIVIGNNATIIGTFGGAASGSVYSAYGGKVTIGNGATIINDGTGNEIIGSTSDDYDFHIAVLAIRGGSVTIGEKSIIQAKGNKRYNLTVMAGSADQTNEHGITGTVNIGAEAKITTYQSQSHALYSQFSGSLISVGANSTITTKGSSSPTAYAIYGGNISIGSSSTLITENDSSIGICVINQSKTGNGEDDLGKSSITTGAEVKIYIQGSSSYGVNVNRSSDSSAEYGAEANLGEENLIETQGQSSYGIYASGLNSVINVGKGSSVIIKGENSSAVYANNTSKISIGEKNKIITQKGNSPAIYMEDTGMVTIGSGTTILTEGENSDVFYFSGSSFTTDPYVYKGLSAISNKSNLISNYVDDDLEISFLDQSDLYGDIFSDNDGADITVNLNFSKWQGSATQSDMINFDLNLKNGSEWIIGKDSNITKLKMDGLSELSWITFLHEDNEYYNTVIKELSGKGNILMNVDLSELNSDGDFLEIGDASGEFSVSIVHNNKGGVDRLNVISVENDNGVDFSLLDDVQIGSYKYELKSEDDNNKLWFYLNLTGRDVDIEYDLAKSVMAMFELGKSVDATLSDELLTKKNKIWAISSYKMQKFSHEDLSSDFKQQIGSEIIGLNHTVNEKLSVGQFLGLTIGKQNFRAGSTGKITNFTTGFYATYFNGGFTANVYTRFADYIHKLSLLKENDEMLNETLNTLGFSVSAQVAHKIPLTGSGLYLQPKAKATYTYIAEKVYDIGGMEVVNYSEKGFVTWLGMRLGMDKEKEAKPYTYYLEAGWIHDANPSITYILVEEGSEGSVTLGKNRFEIGIGFDASLITDSNFQAEVKFAKGSGITEPVKVKIGGSFSY